MCINVSEDPLMRVLHCLYMVATTKEFLMQDCSKVLEGKNWISSADVGREAHEIANVLSRRASSFRLVYFYVSCLRMFSVCLCDITRVSKGVWGLPGNFQSATGSVPSAKSLMYFGLFLAARIFFIFIAFTMFLPVMVLMPQKFALCFTVGCAFIVGSFFALKGSKNQLLHMFSRERLPFTVGFIGSMVGTIYVSMVLHSYVLSVFFSVLQVSHFQCVLFLHSTFFLLTQTTEVM
ncbi:protein transport protein sft2-like [Magnolia sinica]|uniref:protein transport protein sft2-like n=1 Tax=Magnolia sinica TaxID=86752 RepID=UPI00265928EC|nr:protein transport protein sft2-like [Magnolia sinica]